MTVHWIMCYGVLEIFTGRFKEIIKVGLSNWESNYVTGRRLAFKVGVGLPREKREDTVDKGNFWVETRGLGIPKLCEDTWNVG